MASSIARVRCAPIQPRRITTAPAVPTMRRIIGVSEILHIMKRIALALATLCAATAAAQPTDLAAEAKAWWAHVQFLADDKLEGRNVGTPGYEKAVDYVESQFKAIGLKPAGTSGFRQPVKFDSRKLAADKSQLVLVRDGKEEALVIG